MRVPLLVGLFLFAASHSAAAATWFSANQGTDSPTCGAAKTPCRSISQAIVNASDGDTVVVGPGFYGDLNGNGVFGETGEEMAEVGAGCECAVKIDKRVTVRSREGAAATVIDAGGLEISAVTMVGPGGSNARLGLPNAGFTLTHGQISGVFADFNTAGVRISGNIAANNDASGILVTGAGARVDSNRSFSNGAEGIELAGDNALAQNNVASENTDDGFLCYGANDDVNHNVSSGNAGFGFTGFLTDIEFRSDVAFGNSLGGVLFDTATGGLSSSSLIGNGRTTAMNCGVQNDSGAAISATGNYWGAATGPGADPADDVCNISMGSTTTTSPFKTSELKVHPKALR